jgi:hypothetical protein
MTAASDLYIAQSNNQEQMALHARLVDRIAQQVNILVLSDDTRRLMHFIVRKIVIPQSSDRTLVVVTSSEKLVSD